jgi:hypothetical protein
MPRLRRKARALSHSRLAIVRDEQDHGKVLRRLLCLVGQAAGVDGADVFRRGWSTFLISFGGGWSE